jgi:hypothetical protein
LISCAVFSRIETLLTREQAERLIAALNTTTLRKARPRVTAVLVGCDLRRKEATTLSVEHIFSCVMRAG